MFMAAAPLRMRMTTEELQRFATTSGKIMEYNTVTAVFRLLFLIRASLASRCK